MLRKTFDIIVATEKNNGIGINNKLPWNIPKELKYFTDLTSKTNDIRKQNAVIMGRKTYESIGKNLQFRKNIIITRDMKLDNVITKILNDSSIENTFIIGGETIYNKSILDPRLNHVYKTEIQQNIPCDRFFPKLGNEFILEEQSKLHKHKSFSFTFNKYTKRNTDELQYLDLAQYILDNGIHQNDRTNTGTISSFGHQLKFDIRHHLPVITTKKINIDSIVKELLWFISGKTDTKILFNQGVNIWNGNSSKSFNIQQGFPYRIEGDLGPVYGHQWRHCGASYIDCHTDYTNQGIDQLNNVIQSIKCNPTDRGHIINSWNVIDIPKMNLRPCHPFMQFYVDTINNELSCNFYQRSSDLFLGAPYNITSYAILTYLIANITNLKPGYLTMSLGDTHIYKNHVEQFKKQLSREPFRFPELTINRKLYNIDDVQLADILINNYQWHKPIYAPMAI